MTWFNYEVDPDWVAKAKKLQVALRDIELDDLVVNAMALWRKWEKRLAWWQFLEFTGIPVFGVPIIIRPRGPLKDRRSKRREERCTAF